MNLAPSFARIPAALAFSLAAAAAFAADAPATVSDGVYVGANGMTLYTFDKDAAGSGKSACNGPCAQNWPPLAAPANAVASGDWTLVTRDDGSRQWAFKGKPLYYWTRDAKPGDKTGDGFANNAWHVAKP